MLRRVLVGWMMVLFAWTLLACGGDQDRPKAPPSLTSFSEVASCLQEKGRLPENFITKSEARKRGWDPARGNLWDVAPGRSIGGDVFHNREGKLPHRPGRIWYEADIGYRGGRRTPWRIVFSNDGQIYKTEDHYRTFSRINP